MLVPRSAGGQERGDRIARKCDCHQQDSRMNRTELIERLAAQNSSSKAESGRTVETLLEAASRADDERAHVALPCEMSTRCHVATPRIGSQGGE